MVVFLYVEIINDGIYYYEYILYEASFMNQTVREGGIFFKQLLIFAVLLALIVIVLGAYTRLSDAGLGCPDWPGCYGHVTVPEKLSDTEFKRPLESAKAWKEMIHRYVAGTLGLLILLVFFMVLRGKTAVKQSFVLPLLLVVVVVFQALLGMWTVTLKLSPVVVSAHLLGGLTTLSLLWCLYLNQRNRRGSNSHGTVQGLKFWAALGLFLVIGQIFLGGWTSSNYAALACGTDFPTCLGSWWPNMDFTAGFRFLHEPGKNYEFGVLDTSARSAIQMAHRIGALIVFIYLAWLAIRLIKSTQMTKLGFILLLMLFLQVSLGISNVVMALPLNIAVSHNLVAALLLLTLLTINHRVRRG